MSAYANDSRVQQVGAGFVVDQRWWVQETGQSWDAWPYPDCDDPGFDDQAYAQTHLRGLGAGSADEKIRELIGDPA